MDAPQSDDSATTSRPSCCNCPMEERETWRIVSHKDGSYQRLLIFRCPNCLKMKTVLI